MNDMTATNDTGGKLVDTGRAAPMQQPAGVAPKPYTKHDMPNADYHRHPSISKSGLDRIAISPAHFKCGTGFAGSDATRIGSAFHSWVLEGRQPITAPEVARRSKNDRQVWADWMTSHGADGEDIAKLKADEWLIAFTNQTRLDVLTPAELIEVTAMRDAIARNLEARRLLLDTDSRAEVSMFAQIDGVDVRTRPDLIHEDAPVIVDLKTALTAEPRQFARAAASRRYSVQRAMYSEVYAGIHGAWPDFPFVVVEKSRPYCCVVYRLSAEAVENGHWLMTRDLGTYRDCMASGEWPGYPDNADLSIPIYERETFDLDFGGELLSVA